MRAGRHDVRDSFTDIASRPQAITRTTIVPGVDMFVRMAQGGDGTRLHNGKAALLQHPLNIHRLPIQRFNAHANTRQFCHLSRAEDRLAALLGWNGLFAGTVWRAYRHHILLIDLNTDSGCAVFVDKDRIGCYQPTDNRFAQSPCSVDHHLSVITGQWIGGEEYARSIGLNQCLHHHRQAHRLHCDLVAETVGDSSCGPQRRPATRDGVEYLRFATDVQERLVLPGKRETRKIFGSRRRANGNG